MSAMEQIYWLSREPNLLELLEDMWSTTWSMLFSSVSCGCCDGQLCHGLHPPTDHHACFRIDIMIKSNKMVQLPMQWLYSKFLGIASTTLVEALGTRFDQFASELNIYRPGKLDKEAWKISPLINPFNVYTRYSHVLDRLDVTFDYADFSGTDWSEYVREVEGDGLYLPIARQVLTVTGPWYKSTKPAGFGSVVGDCKFKPIEERDFTDKWEDGWEYDERNYIEHHEVVHEADATEYKRIKTKRNKPNRRDKREATCGRDGMKRSVARAIVYDLEEYYEECMQRSEVLHW